MIVEVTLGDGTQQVEVPESEVVRFPAGVFGFEKLRRFALFELDAPFFLLQSIDDPHVGFVVVDPFFVNPSYRVESREAAESLNFVDGDSRTMLCIVTMGKMGSPDAVNLRAPIIMNATKKLGTQVILQEEWPVRQSLHVAGAADATPEATMQASTAEGRRC